MKVTIINGGLVPLFLATALSREVREIGPGVAYEHDGGEFAVLDNNPLVDLHRRADEAAERARREVIDPEGRKPDPEVTPARVDTASPDAPGTGAPDPNPKLIEGDGEFGGGLLDHAPRDVAGAGAKSDFPFPRGGDNTTDK